MPAKKQRLRKPNTTRITAMKKAIKPVLGRFYVIAPRFDSIQHLDDPDENMISFRSTKTELIVSGDYMVESGRHLEPIPTGAMVYYVEEYRLGYGHYHRVGYGDTFGLIPLDTIFYEVEGF